MAELTLIDKDKLEDLFGMSGGYVLDFKDANFASFFQDMHINIDDPKYTHDQTSKSKAKRLRGFWKQENNNKVGTAIEKLINYAEYLKSKSEERLTETDKKLIADCRDIANRLTGKIKRPQIPKSRDEFLSVDFGELNFSKLPIEGQLEPILKDRLSEAKICLEHGANLAVIFMAGSILEGVMLGAAQKYPRQFNESSSCPKDDETNKPKQLGKWTLSQLINVGREIGILGEDVKKFSHALRDFRNYIHPYQQMVIHFKPDKDTAEICLQVLKAALSDLRNKPNE